jgi:Na+-driven multidrug efflux pump
VIAFAEVLTVLIGIYLAVGVLFAAPFVLRGVNRIDPVAREGTWGFRLIIVPGVVALWPLLALRWLRGAGPPEERNAHRLAAKRGAR